MKKALFSFLIAAPASAVAATAPASSTTGLNLMNGGQSVSAPMQVVILMTVLTLLPAVVMCVTPFLRITVVLHFLRQALGTQTTPSNQVMLGLALFLSVLVMQPVATEMYQKGWEPMEQGKALDHRSIHRGFKTASDISVEIRSRERYSALPRNLPHARPTLTEGPGYEGSGASLYSF